jgi:LysM repeat protein
MSSRTSSDGRAERRWNSDGHRHRREDHTVKAGDTLSKIAKETLGNAGAYMKIST